MNNLITQVSHLFVLEWISVLNELVEQMIQWFTYNDSQCFFPEWISVLNKLVEGMIQWLFVNELVVWTNQLNEWFNHFSWMSVLKESIEYFRDSLINAASCSFSVLIKLFERMIQWFIHKYSHLFIPEWISVLNESVEPMIHWLAVSHCKIPNFAQIQIPELTIL